MNAIALPESDESEFEIVDDTPFFAPVATDLVDSLIGQYKKSRQHIDQLAAIVDGELGNVVSYFIEGNCGEERFQRAIYVDKLFQAPGAVAALNSAYWSKALALTDVLDMMPKKRRDEWFESIREQKTPDFEATTVRDTILSLLNMRQQFLAERVDGIFRGLSGEHVTNAPEAFGKRMIVARALSVDRFSSSVDHGTSGLLNDLRAVIAKFMGRDEPKYNATSALLNHLMTRYGEWVSIDGGALRMRLYKKGTAHIEVHPDMAWRLNCILAHLHPMAIPASFRAKPKRRSKEHQTIDRPLPFAVLQVLAEMRQPSERIGTGWPERYAKIHNALSVSSAMDTNKVALDEAYKVLEAIGGVRVMSGSHLRHFQFEYDANDVVSEIVASGCIPDQKSHQFYPTPESVAREAADLAEIDDSNSVLEPSAGHGDLAAFLPKGRTRCVEISALRCSVLKARGFDTVQADFLEWAAKAPERFDRVVMNPPFSDGRWQAHTEAAAGLLRAGGRLVAVLPASARNSYTLPGMACEWSRVFSNEFAGTSVSVAILTASRSD